MKWISARWAGITAALLAAAFSTPVTSASATAVSAPSPKPGQHVTFDIGQPTRTPELRAGLCQGGDADYNRTESCWIGTNIPVVIRADGQPVGQGMLDATSEATLNPRDRYQWQHKVTLKIHNWVGTPVPFTGTTGIKCDKCKASPAGIKTLLPEQAQTFTMDVSSPGGDITTDNMVATTTLTPDYPGAEPPSRTAPLGNAIPVRCDNTPRVSPQKQGGCIYPNYIPTYDVSTYSGRVDQVGWHIWWAQNNLHTAWGRKNHGPALHITRDQDLNNSNRRKACPDSLPRPPGQQCDEYPFASTHEGASKNPDFSCHMVPGTQNEQEGRDRQAFYNSNRLIETISGDKVVGDQFWVNVLLPPSASRLSTPPMPLAQCP
jgi:Deoxyribonuclease NucA/NucB